MLIFNVIDNGLACDCGVCRDMIMSITDYARNIFLKNGLNYLVYFIWYTAV